MAHMKTLTINGETYMVVSPAPVASVKVLASAWVGNSSPYSQVVTLEGVTPDTKVDIQLSDEQLAIFQEKHLGFTTSNKNGVVTISAIGQKPTRDYTFQVSTTEVVNHVGGEIFGNTVGTPMLPPDMAQTDPKMSDYVKNKELYVKATEIDAKIDEAMAKAYAEGKYEGKTAYQYAVDGGYTGTEAEFTEMLMANASGVDRLLILSEEIDVVEPEMAVFKTSCRLVPDMWYTVSWKGKEYVCRCRGTNNGAWIGASTQVLGDHTFPFYILDEYEAGEYIIVTNETGQISITTGREPVYEIGDEYVTAFDWEAGKKNIYRTIYHGAAAFGNGKSKAEFSGLDLSRLAVGETYRIFWWDKYYDCVLQSDSAAGEGTWYWLGNQALSGSTSGGFGGTGEPFCLHQWNVGMGLSPICTVWKDDTREETVKYTISHLETVTVGDGAIVPQPDLNQNDQTKPDYVKNRTHWIEDGGLVEVLPECQPVYDDAEGSFYVTEGIPTLEIGETYTVKWNGTEYEVVGLDLYALSGGEMSGVVLGNKDALGGEDSGEPFAMALIPAYGALAVMPLDGTTELTLAIYGKGEIVHKLDSKFLDLEWMAAGGADITLLPSTTVPLEGNIFQMEGKLFDMNAGDEFCVYWNGSPYECVVLNFDGILLTGNLAILGGADNGMPFVLAYSVEDNASMLVSMTPAETVTIEIVKSNGNDPIPEKYLPKVVPLVKTATIGQTVAVKSVDENGKPTAWEAVDFETEHPVPDASTATEGAFLRVVDGKWAAVVLPNAEEGWF